MAEQELSKRAFRAPHLGGDELTSEALEPFLHSSLFGKPDLILDLEGLKPDKALLERMLRLEANTAILDPAPPATRRKAYEKSGAQILDFPVPTKPPEMTAWLTRYATDLGLQLERPAAAYLVEVLGNDLAGMASELNKLTMLAPPYTREKVQDVVRLEPPGDSFALLAALTARQPEKALLQAKQLAQSGEDPFKLMGLLVWQYSLIARCFGALQAGIPEQGVAARLGTSPYPTKKALEVARRMKGGEPQLRQAFALIAEAEMKLKTGRPPQATFERLLIALATL